MKKKLFVFLAMFLFIVMQQLIAQTKQAYQNICDSFFTIGKYDSSLRYARLAEPDKLDSLGKPSLDYAWFISQYYSFIQWKMNNFDSAAYWFKYSLHAFEALNDTTSPQYCGILANLGNMINENVSYTEAFPYLQKAYRIGKTYEKKAPWDYAAITNGLATYYNYSGGYSNAERLYRQAWQLIDTLPIYPWSKAIVLDNLAQIYLKTGDLSAAEKNFIMAVQIMKSIKDNRGIYFEISEDLANAYLKNNQLDKADYIYNELYNDSIFTNKNINNPQNEYVGAYPQVLIGMGDVKKAKGKYADAERFYRQSILFTQKLNMTLQIQFASIYSLANFFTETNKYKQADSVFEGIVGKMNLGNKDRYRYTEMYVSYCKNLMKMKKTQKAAEKTTFIIKSLLEDLHNNFPGMTEREQMGYVHSLGSYISLAFSAYSGSFSQNKKLIKEALNQLLQLKGMIITYQARRLQSLRISSDSTLANLNKQWLNLKQILYKKYCNNTFTELNASNLEKEADEINKKIYFNTGNWPNNLNEDLVGEIGKKLKNNEAAIEFLRYKNVQTEKNMYGVFIMQPNKEPIYIELCKEAELYDCLKEDSKKTTSIQSQVVKGKKIYDLLWKPIEKILREANTIYYSPDGLLNYFSFDGITIPTDSYLLNKKNMVLLSSTKNLLDNNLNKNEMEAAVLWGQIDCSEKAYVNIRNNAVVTSLSTLTDGRAVIDNGLLADLKKGGRQAGFSVWKDEELPAIAKMAEQKNLQVELFTQKNATEENFKANASTFKGILHVSSHGFYADQTLPEKSVNPHPTSAFRDQINPLLRCGLILNGGNYVWSGKKPLPDREDGILTGYEIALLDLSKVDLVVLSACETGLGDIDAGSEGVLGLQRAFKLAGVKKMVLTLWEVNVNDTKIFMTYFYKELLNGKSAVTALRNAKIQMAKKYPPLAWAGFILIE